MKMSFKIESDCLDIVKRIQAIDKDYFVLFNPTCQKFELHNSAQKNSYCLTFPYDCLDERAVTFVLKTRVQNADELFAQMEAENEKIKQKQIKEILNDFKERLYDS